MLASSHGDGSVNLWDVPSRKRIGEFRGYSSSVYSVAFSPDGRLLASGSCKEYDLVECGEGQIVFWNVWPEFWKAKACRMANRNLSREEWRHYFGDEAYRKTCLNLPGPAD
jgi:WD40 repeat protein